MDRIYMTKKQLAEIAGYSYRRLHDIEQTLPEEERFFVEGKDKKCDLAIFVQRWVDYKVSIERNDGESLDDVKAAHEKVKTRKTELEVARLEGRMVDIDDVRKLWGDIAGSAMQNFLNLPSKIAPMVVMMGNIEQISSIIDEQIRKTLEILSETPVPDYAQDDEDENAAEDTEV